MEHIEKITKIAKATTEALQRATTEIAQLAKDVEDDGNLADICELWYTLKEINGAWETERKALYHVMNLYEKTILPERFEKEDVDKLAVDRLGRSFYPQKKYGNKVHDKEKLYGWLDSVGASDLISTTINAGTLTTFIKDLLMEQGIEAPADVVELTSYSQMGSSKYTPKKKV